MFKIDSQLSVGPVTLSVADLRRSLDYYTTQIGLRVQQRTADAATLGAGARPLLHLQHAPGARRYPAATGLYHFALRVPTRHALARFVRHLIDAHVPVDGASDHHVSEALYLSDADGHGIEVYVDRPRSAWLDAAGNFHMTTERLDIGDLLGELGSAEPAWDGLADGSDMGHVHLQVSDVAAAEQFYTQALGMDTMAHYPGAAFVSAGGYHHHLGLNVWHSRNARPAPGGAARLLAVVLQLPDAAAVAALAANLTAHGVPFERAADGTLILADPAGNPLRVAGATD